MPDQAQPNLPNARAEDPISMAKNAGTLFKRARAESAKSRLSCQEWLYEGLSEAFRATLTLYADQALLTTFLKDPYFIACRVRPRTDHVARAVLYLAADARDDRERNRPIKHAAVLEQLRREGAAPDDFVDRVKQSGGIAKFYREVCHGTAAGQPARTSKLAAPAGATASDMAPPPASVQSSASGAEFPSQIKPNATSKSPPAEILRLHLEVA